MHPSGRQNVKVPVDDTQENASGHTTETADMVNNAISNVKQIQSNYLTVSSTIFFMLILALILTNHFFFHTIPIEMGWAVLQ